ncbi:MAG: hypothetical protein LBJ11_03325 [Oscillospiraceae bacterium]|jgi:hypothetical protein|nr:hypothetical protein [Oscillospiraceae bacterium]
MPQAAQQVQQLFIRTATAQGIASELPTLYHPQEGWRAWLCRGGLGGGTEAFLRRMADLAQTAGRRVECFPDARGGDSLCAVRLPDEKFCFLDADGPGAWDLRCPGACEETVALNVFWHKPILQERRGEILRLMADLHREQARCVRFLKAARAIKRDMAFVAAGCTDAGKVERYAARFAARHFPAPSGRVGLESRRFLTAVTGQGLLLRRAAVLDICPTVFLFEDDCGAAVPGILSILRAYALGNGLDVFQCPCLLDPDGPPEHLLLPQLGLALLSVNRRHPIDLEGAQRVLSSRFLEKEDLRAHRCRLSFCRRTLHELLEEAYEAAAAAERTRASLDEIYAAATDFPALLAQADSIWAGQ